MVLIGYHASHEQVRPGRLLEAVRCAEAAGFGAAMCSDHFAPWSTNQGQSGFAWSWLGASLQATSLPFGVVTAPVQRYHPAVAAQAIGTLADMYPERLWVALGSGEALNEHITGDPWPDKAIRDRRLVECATVIRALLHGEEVDHRGLVTVDRCRLWTVPDRQPMLFGAAVSPATAATVGRWADGMITVDQPLDTLAGVIESFRDAGGGSKPVYVQVHLCWDADPERARRIAFDQWRTNVLPHPQLWELDSPEAFERAARHITSADVESAIVVSSDLSRHIAKLRAVIDLGVQGVFVHHVGQDQLPFIDAFGEHVLPALA